MDKFFDSYQTEGFFDEMFSAPGQVRPHYGKLLERFQEMDQSEFERKRALADTSFLSQGITFTVYNDSQGTEKIFPVRPDPAHHPGGRMGSFWSAA